MYEQDEQDLPPGFVLDQQTSDLPPGFVLDSQPKAATQEPVPMGPPAPVKRTAADAMVERIGDIHGKIKSGEYKVPFDLSATGLPGQSEKPIGESLKDLTKKRYWGRLLTKEFWNNVGNNLLQAAGDAFVEPTSPVGIIRSTQQMAEQATAGEFPTPKQELRSAVDQVVSYAPPVFIGKVVGGLLTDPVGTIENDPLGVIIVAAGFSGEAKNAYKKHRAGKPIDKNDVRKVVADVKNWSEKAANDPTMVESAVAEAERLAAQAALLKRWEQSPEPEAPPSYHGILYKPADVTGGGARPKPDPTGEAQMRLYEAMIKGRTDVIPLEELITGEQAAGQTPVAPHPVPPPAPLPIPPPAQPGAVKVAPKAVETKVTGPIISAKDVLPELHRHADSVLSTGKVKSVELVGSLAQKGKGHDVDIIYDIGKIKLPSGQAGAEKLIDYIELNDIPIGDVAYDNWIKVGDRYFHRSFGAGADLIESNAYAAEQVGKPRIRLGGERAVTSPLDATAAKIESRPKTLDLSSEQMKMGIEEFEASTKKLYAGMPFDSKLFESLKKGFVSPVSSYDKTTGEAKVAPVKFVGPGDHSAYAPAYSTKPKTIKPDSFNIEKRAGGKQGGMPGYKHELESLQAQKDMPATKIKHEYENPVRWFDNSPFLKDSLYYPWRSAENSHMHERISIRKQVNVWRRHAPGEADLGAYAIAKQKNGPEMLKQMGLDTAAVIARVEANPGAMKVYSEARSQLERMFVRLNEARAIAGKPPLPKVENYFTFARGAENLETMGVNLVEISDPAIIKQHLYEPTFKYKKRENVVGPASLMFYGVFEKYMTSASRYTMMAPVVAKGNVLLGDWTKTDSLGREIGDYNLKSTAPNLYNMTREWVDRIAGKHITTNRAFAKALSALSKNYGAAVIAFNPRSTIIQPTSLHNTYVEVGGKFLAKGIEKYALDEANRQFAMRTSEVLTGRAMDFHLEDLWADGMAKAINKGRSDLSSVGTYPLRALDAMSAQISWLAAYEKGKADGLTGENLIRYADDVVVKTQASAKTGDVARIQTKPLGKLATIFQTFVINNWNYWSKDVFGWKNPEMANKERVKKVARLVFGAVLINTLFEDVIGINSPLPAPEREIVAGIRGGKGIGEIAVNVAKEVAESVPVVGGSIKYTTERRQSAMPVVQQYNDINSLWQAAQRIANTGDITKFKLQDWRVLAKLLGVPGGDVAINMYRKAQAGMSFYEIISGAPLESNKGKKKPKAIQ